MKKSIIRYLFIGLHATFTSCNHGEPAPIDRQAAILGKWEVVDSFSGPVDPDGSYTEFLSDSIHTSYIKKTDEIFESTYWFEDSLLQVSTTYGIVGEDETITIVSSYTCEFFGPNRMRHVYIGPSLIPIVNTYRRID